MKGDGGCFQQVSLCIACFGEEVSPDSLSLQTFTQSPDPGEHETKAAPPSLLETASKAAQIDSSVRSAPVDQEPKDRSPARNNVQSKAQFQAAGNVCDEPEDGDCMDTPRSKANATRGKKKVSKSEARQASGDVDLFRVFDRGQWKRAKLCSACGRIMTERRLWKNLAEVKFCSTRCKSASRHLAPRENSSLEAQSTKGGT